MTAFLRNIGQAAGGIAFSIALKALSPELDSTISSFSKDMQEMMKHYKNSCMAASTLMDKSGASKWIEEVSNDAAKQLRLTSSDDTEAQRKAADIQAAKQNANALATSNPNSGLNKERNVVWGALQSGDFAGTFTDVERQLIMSIVGTVVVAYTDPNDASMPIITYKPPLIEHIDDLIDVFRGEKSVSNVTRDLYGCTHRDTAAPSNYPGEISNNCMIVNAPSSVDLGKSFRFRLEESKVAVITAIQSRSPVDTATTAHYKTLYNATSLPLMKVVQSAATSRNAFFSTQMLDKFLDITATEMAIRYLRYAVSIINKVDTEANPSAQTIETMKRVRDNTKTILVSLDAREAALKAEVANLAHTLKLYETLQTYMQNTLGAELNRSLKFGG
jgi:conjugative transfer pilus assembly protein TraH